MEKIHTKLPDDIAEFLRVTQHYLALPKPANVAQKLIKKQAKKELLRECNMFVAKLNDGAYQ